MKKSVETFIRIEAGRLLDCAQLMQEKYDNQFSVIAICGEAEKVVRRLTNAVLFEEVPEDFLRIPYPEYTGKTRDE